MLVAALRRRAAARRRSRRSARATRGSSTVNFTLGYFFLKGIESRVDGGRAAERICRTCIRCCSRSRTSTGFAFGGEYLFGLGRYIEAGVGVGYYAAHRAERLRRPRRTPSDVEIEQELKLRQVPVTFTGRFLLLAARQRRRAVHRRRPRRDPTAATARVGDFVDTAT